MNDIPDYSGYKETNPVIGDNLMGALIDLSDQLQAAEEEAQRLELLLNEAKKNLQNLAEHEIPKLLEGLKGKLSLPDGRVITVTEKIRSHVSSERKSTAMRWLEDNDHGSLIKRRFIIEFGRDQEDWVKKFEAQLETSETPLNIKREHNVHWQTLDAFVREGLEQGEDIPLDLFGVYRQRFAKIKGAK